MNKSCLKCGDLFEAKPSNRMYCSKQTQIRCAVCDTSFDDTCTQRSRQVCSKSCSSKLIRRNQALLNSVVCSGCGDTFGASITGSLYCRQVRQFECRGCGNDFPTECRDGRSNFCNSSCRNGFMRAELYSIKASRTCDSCGDSFNPSMSRQRFCNKDRKLQCGFCGVEFITLAEDTVDGKPHYCGNSCSTLAQSSSKIDVSKLEVFRSPSEWCKRFEQRRGRKPTIHDFKLYVGVNPRAADLDLFRLAQDSYLELLVVNYLEEAHSEIEFLRHHRKVRSIATGGVLELDILLPAHKLAFEIQDFASHSKLNEDELVEGPRWIKRGTVYKKGPTYHANKLRSAEATGVTLVELWEDDLRSGSFRMIVDEAISSVSSH